MAQNLLQDFRETKTRFDNDVLYHREVLRLVKLRSESGQQLTQAENTVIALRRSISDALDTLEQVSGFFGTLSMLGDKIAEPNLLRLRASKFGSRERLDSAQAGNEFIHSP